METLYVVLIIVIIILLLWVITPSTKSRCLNKLNGFWVADDDFCQNSGIDLMTIFFGDYVGCDELPKNVRRYLCWLLIINDAGQFNHITTVDIGLDKIIHIQDDQYQFDIEFKDLPEDQQLFPTSLQIQIVPGELITIVDPETDNKIFEGTKNENASNAIEFNVKQSD